MRAARIDDNQKAITRYLREKGVSVSITSAIGRGFPDLMCGFKGKNILLELKDGAKPLSAQNLTPEQRIWHYDWKGQVKVVNSPEAAWEEIQNQTKE